MDARFVTEGVGAHYSLVGLHRHACEVADQPAGLVYLGGIYVGCVLEQVFAGTQRHHYLFHGGIAGALADAVDGALNLTYTAIEHSQAVGYSQPQIVMAMHAYHSLLNVGHVLDDSFYEGAELTGDGIDRKSTRLNSSHG